MNNKANTYTHNIPLEDSTSLPLEGLRRVKSSIDTRGVFQDKPPTGLQRSANHSEKQSDKKPSEDCKYYRRIINDGNQVHVLYLSASPLEDSSARPLHGSHLAPCEILP